MRDGDVIVCERPALAPNWLLICKRKRNSFGSQVQTDRDNIWVDVFSPNEPGILEHPCFPS
jgi:hypothetical protein